MNVPKSIPLDGRYLQSHDFMYELWCDLPRGNLSKYEISNYSRIRNKETGRILKPRLPKQHTTKTAHVINLHTDAKIPKTYNLKKLVDETFTRYAKIKIDELLTYTKTEFLFNAF